MEADDSLPPVTGDPGLTSELARLASRRCHRVAAVVVGLDASAPIRMAFIRAGAKTLFEVGSITKAMTGMLLADAIDRGELTMTSTIGELLPSLADWIMDGYAPAGGVIATIGDMARLAAALLDRTAPGWSSMSAIPGVSTDRPARRSGMFWIIDPRLDGTTMIWHNGATGGYSAFLALFPQTRLAAAALASVSRPADP